MSDRFSNRGTPLGKLCKEKKKIAIKIKWVLLGGGGLVCDTNLELKLLTSWSWWQLLLLLSLEAPEITDGLLELGMPIFELKFLISSCRCFSSCIKSECFKSGMDLVLLLELFLSDFLYVWEGMWSCCTRKKNTWWWPFIMAKLQWAFLDTNVWHEIKLKLIPNWYRISKCPRYVHT